MAGRPLPQLTLALTYAWAGTDPVPYRVGNLVLHLLCLLVGYLCLRRMLRAPAFSQQVHGSSEAIAAFVTLCVAVHPIGVEVVLYISQRTELMVVLATLGATYGYVRYVEAPRARWLGWLAACSVLGALCKASIAVLPGALLLIDRALYTPRYLDALRSRWRALLCAAAGYPVLAFLEAARPRGVTVTFWDPRYLSLQAQQLPRYLRAVFVPDLSLDYGPFVPQAAADVGAWVFATVACLVALLWLGLRGSRAALAGWVVVLWLLPTSSLAVIHTEVAADRRMYLPLWVLWTVVAVGGAGLAGRLKSGRALATLAAAVVVGVLCVETRAYAASAQDELTLWQRVTAHEPRNPRGHYNVGETFRRRGDLVGAARHYARALGCYPSYPYPEAHTSLGQVSIALGKLDQGLAHLRVALEQRPDALTFYNYGVALGQAGRLDDAAAMLERATALAPGWAPARVKWAAALVGLGRVEQARGVLLPMAADPAVGPLLESLRTSPPR
jgi:tetratricopeptide (TPR) repeat protein